MDLERSYMTGATARGAEFDQGLRSYMLGVYNYMATALAVTGFVALATAMMSVSDGQLTSFGQVLFLSPLKWVIMFAPLGMVFLFASRVDRMAASTLQTLFWVYSVLMGVSLASIFLVYTGESIARVFRHRRRLRRVEPVWLHHQTRFKRYGDLPVHGLDWRRRRQLGQPVPWLDHGPIHDLGGRGGGVRRPDGL